MYIPAPYAVDDRVELVKFMQAHNFAVLVSIVDGVPTATHLPVTVSADADGQIRVSGHMARANPQWHALEEQEVLVIFQGPHAYISPAHYEKRESVPTWNYVAVHAYARVRLHLDEAAKSVVLQDLIGVTEPDYQMQWDTLAERYRHGMLGGIVAFSCEVTRLQGKYKLSQNRSDAERTQIAAALQASDDAVAAETGRLMNGTHVR